MLKQWSKRKRIVFERITIIKSLALLTFVQLFLSLRNPPAELIKELEDFFQGMQTLIENLSSGIIIAPQIFFYLGFKIILVEDSNPTSK